MTAVKSVGSRWQNPTLEIDVRHDPRASYSRCVLPAARRYARRVYPVYAFELIHANLDLPLEDGAAVTRYTFRKTN